MDKQLLFGEKVRYFRNRYGISQFDLELEIDASPGSISRIEAGKVNPTKETVLKISKVLDLSDLEIDYLIGRLSLPANGLEIEKAKMEANEFLVKRGKLAYLLDDRWRFLLISKTFIKLLKIKPDELEYIIGKTTAQTIVRNDSPIISWLDKEHYEELLKSYLPIYFSAMSHLQGDDVYEETLHDILSNPFARKIWLQLTYKNNKKYAPQEERVIYFELLRMKFPLYWSMLPLARNDRFWIVEYKTKNIILDALPYLV